jgi:hypothetical protein
MAILFGTFKVAAGTPRMAWSREASADGAYTRQLAVTRTLWNFIIRVISS